MATQGVPFWEQYGQNSDPYTSAQNSTGGASAAGAFSLPPDAWSIVLAGPNLTPLPGLLDGDIVWKKHPHRVIDRGRGPSADGQNPKILGVGCAEFEIPMVIWTPNQLSALSTLLPQIFPFKSGPGSLNTTPGTSVAPGNGIPGATQTLGLNLTSVAPGGAANPTIQAVPGGPVLFDHPALKLVGIQAAIVEGFIPPVRWKGKSDVKVYKLICIEFRPSVARKVSSPRQIQKTSVNPKLLPQPVATGATPPSAINAGPSQTIQ